jgi:DNA-binding NarL/FixJ family response regulator
MERLLPLVWDGGLGNDCCPSDASRIVNEVRHSFLEGSLMVTFVLADDHVVLRQGLRALLESEPKFVVVGETGDGQEAVELVKSQKPKVLITDLIMPGLNGLETTRKVSRLKSDTHVLILSMYADQPYVLSALEHGAAGYLLKESCGTELFHAIREVIAGRRYLSPAIVAGSIGSFTAMGTILQKMQPASQEAHDKLTVREQTVLKLVVEGASNSDIGIRLKISSRTVESLRASCMKKLGLGLPQELIRYALHRGNLARGQPKSIKRRR